MLDYRSGFLFDQVRRAYIVLKPDTIEDTIAAGIAYLAAVAVLAEYYEVLNGIRNPAPDVRLVWLELATAVNAGSPLYIAGLTTDNKPPGWLLVQIFGEWLNVYFGFNYLLLTIAVMAMVWLVYQELRPLNPQLGILAAAIVFWGILTVGNGPQIGPEVLAVTIAIAAIQRARAGESLRSGLLLGLGALLQQYALLAAPVIVLVSEERRSWLESGATSILTILAGFGIVALLWGQASAITGFRLSILGGWNYVIGRGDVLLVLCQPSKSG